MAIKPHRTHFVVVWDFAGYEMNGEPRVSAPREIRCRWNYNTAANTNQEGTPHQPAATALVNEDIALGSIMYHGCLEEVVGTGTGLEDDQPGPLYIVKSYKQTSDIKGRNPTRELALMRYSNTLPVVA